MCARHACSPLEALAVDSAFDADVYPDEPMRRHTMYRIGGPARFYAQVGSIGALKRLVAACQECAIPWVAVGRGSNLLVSDEGFPGVVIALGRDFRACRFDEETCSFIVGAGVPLSSVVQEAFRRSLSGLEFAVGTPGTVGGAVRMNAGTREQGIADRVVSVTTLSPRSGLVRRGRRISMGYRSSSFAPTRSSSIASLPSDPPTPICCAGRWRPPHARRKKTQPLTLPSCGACSESRRVVCAAQLIRQVGLKGASRRRAECIEVHANFIVNRDNATAQDVLELINMAGLRYTGRMASNYNRKSASSGSHRRAQAPHAAAGRALRGAAAPIQPGARRPAHIGARRRPSQSDRERRARRTYQRYLVRLRRLARRGGGSSPSAVIVIYNSSLFHHQAFRFRAPIASPPPTCGSLPGVPAGTTLLRVDAAGIRRT